MWAKELRKLNVKIPSKILLDVCCGLVPQVLQELVEFGKVALPDYFVYGPINEINKVIYLIGPIGHVNIEFII